MLGRERQKWKCPFPIRWKSPTHCGPWTPEIKFQFECSRFISAAPFSKRYRHCRGGTYRRPPSCTGSILTPSHIFREIKERASEDRRNKEANGCRSKLLHCNNFRISAMRNGETERGERKKVFSAILLRMLHAQSRPPSPTELGRARGWAKVHA